MVCIAPLSIYLLILLVLNCQSCRAGDINRDLRALLSSDGDLKAACVHPVCGWKASLLPVSVKRSSKAFLIFTMQRKPLVNSL